MEDFKEKRVKYWKNQRIIDKNGLVVCQERQRLFDNSECAFLFEDLLKIYQQKGLKLHYVQYILKKSEQNQTITYKVYVDYRCPKQDRIVAKQRIMGEFYVHYRLIRLNQQAVSCQFPYLLLFDLTCGEAYCQGCKQYHLYKITQSSFYVIRTQFVYEIIKKITFMEKYPNYTFTPHSFVSKQSSGDTVYQYVKDHNYEPSYYYERCQRTFANLLKIEMIKRGMDCETARLEQICEGDSAKMQKYLKQMSKFTSTVKLKYMCRKCEGKQIWTTRDHVSIHYGVFLLEPYFKIRLQATKEEYKKFVFEGSEIQKKYKTLFQKKIILETSNPEQKTPIQKLFKVQVRRLDRSIQKEYEQYDEFQKDIEGCYGWHSKMQDYQWPFLVVYSIKIPKMNCRRCQKQKDGLIYITNIVDDALSFLNEKIMLKILERKNKLQKDAKENKGKDNQA